MDRVHHLQSRVPLIVQDHFDTMPAKVFDVFEELPFAATGCDKGPWIGHKEYAHGKGFYPV